MSSNDEHEYAHRIRRGDREVVVYTTMTYAEMGEAYDEDYVGEVCSVSGFLKKPFISPRVEALLQEAAFEFSQGPRGKTAFDLWRDLAGNNTDKTYSTFIESISAPKGDAMHDPLHEAVFGESNLATELPMAKCLRPSSGLNQDWQELYLKDCRDFGVDIANQRLVQRQQLDSQRVEAQLTPAKREELEQLLGATDIAPTREDYSEACKGNRPWPISPAMVSHTLNQLIALGEPLPEIKGVILLGSKLPTHLQAAIEEVLNKPAMDPDEISTFLDEVSRQEAMRFLITPRSEEVINALRKWIKRMRKRAETEALNRRSAEKQLALFKINVEHLERQSFVVLSDIFEFQGFSRKFIIDNVEDTTFNVSVKTENGGVPIMTVRYDDYGFTVKAHR